MSKHIVSHGKVILFGEHAAVYGHPALAAGLAGALEVQALRVVPAGVRVRVPRWGVNVGSGSPCPIGEALAILERLVPGRGGCEVVAGARIPMGAGLGSSAALAVLLARTLATVRNADIDDTGIRAIAHHMEKVFHGTPSGLDDAVATFGGMCLFRRGGWNGTPPPAIPHSRLDADVLGIPFSVPGLAIGDTGISRSTADVVASVRALRMNQPDLVNHAFQDIDTCLSAGLDALSRGDMDGLGRALSENHRLLTSLGVSCPQADRMVAVALEAGALGAKLTGAGAGGCVIALAPGREQAIVSAWAARGFDGLVMNDAVQSGLPKEAA